MIDNYIIVMLSLMMQTWRKTPKSTRKRIALFTVIAAGTLIFCIWDAQLISFLTTPHYHLPFHSLYELLNHTNYKVHKKKNVPNLIIDYLKDMVSKYALYIRK